MTWEPARVGDSISSVETPCLVLEEEVFHANLKAMQGEVGRCCPASSAGAHRDGVVLRPHAKAHKCSAIAKIQIEQYGAVGVCCQKVSEAVAMVSSGVGDVLITNEIVDVHKLDRLAVLSELHPDARVALCIDSEEGLNRVRGALEKHPRVTWDVLIEMSCGSRRCGVQLESEVIDLMKKVLAVCDELVREKKGNGGRADSQLRFRGIQAYNGKNQHIRNPKDRQATVNMLVNDKVIHLTDLLGLEDEDFAQRLGLSEDHRLHVTGGGTGSYKFEAKSGRFAEVQPGSYALMDADYAKNEDTGALFHHSLFIMSTIMSVTKPREKHGGNATDTWAVLDVGLKGQSLDSGPPTIHRFLGLSQSESTELVKFVEYAVAGDEHSVLSLRADASPHAKSLFAKAAVVGGRVFLVPGHVDPTVNAHDWFVVVDAAHKVSALWKIDARSAGL
eukprot:ANDGO_02164.mRNA.1 D-threonine aldolase